MCQGKGAPLSFIVLPLESLTVSHTLSFAQKETARAFLPTLLYSKDNFVQSLLKPVSDFGATLVTEAVR